MVFAQTWDIWSHTNHDLFPPRYSRLMSYFSSINLTAEDSLNMALKDITVTARDGRVSQLEQVYIRGSMVSSRAAK